MDKDRRTEEDTDFDINKWLLSHRGLNDGDIEATYHRMYCDGATGSYFTAAKALLNYLGAVPQTIYYPGSNVDLSAAKAFSHSRVIHVDLDSWSIDKLKAGGYEAYLDDRDEFIPDTQADVVILFNAGYIADEQLKKITAARGIVLANNYHRAASFMLANCPSFELTAAAQADLNPEHVIEDFDASQLEAMPSSDDYDWPAHSETIFAFRRIQT